MLAIPAIPSISRRVKREFDSISVIGDGSAASAAISICFFFILIKFYLWSVLSSYSYRRAAWESPAGAFWMR
jgi:hypothetical protein